jgi:DNA polymerase-1
MNGKGKYDSSAPLILADGSFYLHRAYHALPPLSTKAGFPTHAIRGMASMLMSLQDSYCESAVVIVMDAPGKTFRSERYSEYKANRPPMPDDLRLQVDKVAELIEAMGLPRVCEPGVEADDVIGTLATRAETMGRKVIISSGDKDLMQLVSPSVTVIDTMRRINYDEAQVKTKYGVPPKLIIDWLALCGDSSDNIPGVAGIGPKTAEQLLNNYGGLDDLYSNLEDVAGSDIRGARNIVKKLEEHKETAYLSQWLATIKKDVSLDFDLEHLMPAVARTEELLALFTELEFNSLAQKVHEHGHLSAVRPRSSSPEPASAEPEPEEDWMQYTILNESTLKEWVKRLGGCEYFALDTEATSLDHMQARLVGISVALNADLGAYIPIGHDYEGAPTQLSEKTVLHAFKGLLEDENISKIGHNLKYDRSVLANHGISLRGIRRDTMLESYVLDSSRHRRDLSSLTRDHLGHASLSYEDVAGKGAQQIPFNKVPLAQAAPYALSDACDAWALDHQFCAEFSQQQALKRVFEEMEMPLLTVLSDMERCGVLVDKAMLLEQSKSLASQISDLQNEIWDISGQQFNTDSPKQLREILYKKLDLPVLGKTPKGEPSTAEGILEKLSSHHPLPKVLLSYRELVKLKSTYTDRLPERINATTGRIHTSWHQASVATGRLSSSQPNLQNIPIRTGNGRQIRRAFVAEKGCVLVAADYSQIELRVMAHISGDEGMCRAFGEDADIHSITAAEVFGVDISSVDSAQRRKAKAINFGLIYGMSNFGLARQIGVTQKEAQDYIDRYFHRYTGVRDYMNRARTLARDRGYVETLSGRRLKILEIDSKNVSRRWGAERVAINAPIQGTAADIIKRAMLAVHEAFPPEDSRTRLIMQVHDELVLETRKEALDEVQATLRTMMENAMSLKVPLKVDMGMGNNWDEAHA